MDFIACLVRGLAYPFVTAICISIYFAPPSNRQKKKSAVICLTIGCVNLQLKKVQNEGQTEAVKNSVPAFSYSANCCTKINIAQSGVCTFGSISAFIHHSQLASLWKLNYIFNTNHTSFVLNERSAWAHWRTGSLLMQCYHMHWGQYLTSHSPTAQTAHGEQTSHIEQGTQAEL